MHFLLFFLLLPLAGNAQSDTVLMRHHLSVITRTPEFCNYENMDMLNEIALYIFNTFSAAADTVYYQTYTIGKRTYRNVIGSFGTQFSERIIVGAHYDVCGNQQGADDNASGMVGLLELSRQLKSGTLNKRIDLVALHWKNRHFSGASTWEATFTHSRSWRTLLMSKAWSAWK
jgi:hypothetical protein